MNHEAATHWEECKRSDCPHEDGRTYVCECGVTLVLVYDAPRADASLANVAKNVFARRGVRSAINLGTAMLVTVGIALFVTTLVAWRRATFLQLLFALFPCFRCLLALDIFMPLAMNTAQLNLELFMDGVLILMQSLTSLVVVPILFANELIGWPQLLMCGVNAVAIVGSCWVRRRELVAYVRWQNAHARPLASDS